MANNNPYCYFFILEYTYTDEQGDHFFNIGCFSSKKKAKEALSLVKDKPGFCSSNGKFVITGVRVYFPREIPDKESVALFGLFHEFLDADGFDNYTTWGPFATEEEAQEVLESSRGSYPYNEYPDGFTVYDIKVNLCGWTEGFRRE